MLVLSRKRDESIMIGDGIELKVVAIRGDKVRLGIEAPAGVSVHRREVYEAIQRMTQEESGDEQSKATDQAHGRQTTNRAGEPPGAPDHADPADGRQA